MGILLSRVSSIMLYCSVHSEGRLLCMLELKTTLTLVGYDVSSVPELELVESDVPLPCESELSEAGGDEVAGGVVVTGASEMVSLSLLQARRTMKNNMEIQYFITVYLWLFIKIKKNQ